MFRLLLPLAAAALIVAPLTVAPASAQGRGRCDADDLPGVTIEFGISIGKRDRQTQERLWKMQLQQHGVHARTVKRTRDGCLEVYLQEPDGSFNTRYYDEDTFELVQE